MSNKKFNPSLFEEILAAAAISFVVLFSPLLRPWYSKWGATKAELTSELPGDDQVVSPNLENTRAITINVPKESVWPWLLQMGQGRGGLYSYERLENLVGCQMDNADQIIPMYQELKVGDKILLTPEGGPPPFMVTAVEQNQAIILGGSEPPTTWGFILEPIDEGSTRLIIRFRQSYRPTIGNTIMWRVFTDPINFVMERKMLQGIKSRSEKV